MAYSFAAIDEAGQTGFKFDRGSTRFFVVTCLLTDEPQQIRAGLAQLRHELGLAAATELKFHSTPHAFRLKLLEQAAHWPLVVRALAVDKRGLPHDFQRFEELGILRFLCSRVAGSPARG